MFFSSFNFFHSLPQRYQYTDDHHRWKCHKKEQHAVREREAVLLQLADLVNGNGKFSQQLDLKQQTDIFFVIPAICSTCLLFMTGCLTVFL